MLLVGFRFQHCGDAPDVVLGEAPKAGIPVQRIPRRMMKAERQAGSAYPLLKYWGGRVRNRAVHYSHRIDAKPHRGARAGFW